jgi:alanine racemase
MESRWITVTTLCGRLALGGRLSGDHRPPGEPEVTTDELAAMIGTIRDEVVARNGHRVPRTPVTPCAS